MKLLRKAAFVLVCGVLLSLPEPARAEGDCYTCAPGIGCSWSSCTWSCENFIYFLCPLNCPGGVAGIYCAPPAGADGQCVCNPLDG